MNVYIGADHRGVSYKAKIIDILTELGHGVYDVGAYDSKASCDYPKSALEVGQAVAKNRNTIGILVCMSGIGQTIAANKVKGVLAALCYNPTAAKLSRQHNNANVLVLSSKFVKNNQLKRIIKTFIETKFEGGRHLRRVNQIRKIEKKQRI